MITTIRFIVDYCLLRSGHISVISLDMRNQSFVLQWQQQQQQLRVGLCFEIFVAQRLHPIVIDLYTFNATTTKKSNFIFELFQKIS